MAAFQLSLPGFDGPVESLAPLVSARRLALDEIALAEIPAQFLAETKRQEVIDLELAGEIAATTARLMLLKSAQLLAEPVDDEDEPVSPIHDEETAEAFRRAARRLSYSQGAEMFPSHGRLDLVPQRKETRPADLLGQSWRSLLARQAAEAVRAAVPAFLRLETAVSGLIARLRGGAPVSFHRSVRGGTRRDVVVHFLAALELIRRRQATATQTRLFSDITLESLVEHRDFGERAG